MRRLKVRHQRLPGIRELFELDTASGLTLTVVTHRSGRRDIAIGTRVCLAGRPPLDQQLRVGRGAPGWDSPATLADRRAAGSILVVDLSLSGADEHPDEDEPGPDTAILRLDDPAAMVAALAADVRSLGRRLDSRLASLSHQLARRPPHIARRPAERS